MGTEQVAASGFEPVQAVADAIMYEGYLLYPYRRSSPKNQIRWQFGVLAPRAWAEAHGQGPGVAGSAESWWQRTECLLEADQDAELRCRIRFLQVQRRSVEERRPDGTFHPVDSLTVGPDVELSFDEAIPREFDVDVPVRDLLSGARRCEIDVPGGTDVQPLAGGHGRVSSRRCPVRATVVVTATDCRTSPPLLRLRVQVENADETATPHASREEILRVSLISCHTLLTVRGGAFVSLLDPPAWAEAAARDCSNVHTYPVLAGEEGRRDLVLSSPILLYDHPRVAPESPGDLHDATEIDEILSLRTLTLTDEEKREARATDPRAAAILDRVDTMPPEVLGRLHGTVRSMSAVTIGAGRDEPPGDDGTRPEPPDAVEVNGVRVTKGSRVRLRPRTRGTDPQDAFLDGRVARVESVLVDVDGEHHLAVTLEDDPGADLHRWYGRFRYFSPREVDPLAEGEEQR